MNIEDLPIKTIDELQHVGGHGNETEIINNIIKPMYHQFLQHYVDNDTVEVMAAQLRLNPLQPFLSFGGRSTNQAYCQKELDWYLSQDLSIIDHVDDVKIWNECATKDDYKFVNSNYGYLVFNKGNGNQFENCLEKLKEDKNTRNAIIEYQRPEIYEDMCKDGMHDMICTFFSHFLIRDNKLYMIHTMRSNDLIFGFLNDWAWNCFVYQNMYQMLLETYPNLEVGEVIWTSNSMHVYKRHWKLLQQMINLDDID